MLKKILGLVALVLLFIGAAAGVAGASGDKPARPTTTTTTVPAPTTTVPTVTVPPATVPPTPTPLPNPEPPRATPQPPTRTVTVTETYTPPPAPPVANADGTLINPDICSGVFVTLVANGNGVQFVVKVNDAVVFDRVLAPGERLDNIEVRDFDLPELDSGQTYKVSIEMSGEGFAPAPIVSDGLSCPGTNNCPAEEVAAPVATSTAPTEAGTNNDGGFNLPPVAIFALLGAALLGGLALRRKKNNNPAEPIEGTEEDTETVAAATTSD